MSHIDVRGAYDGTLIFTVTPHDQAPWAYETFQKKEDGAFKIVLNP